MSQATVPVQAHPRALPLGHAPPYTAALPSGAFDECDVHKILWKHFVNNRFAKKRGFWPDYGGEMTKPPAATRRGFREKRRVALDVRKPSELEHFHFENALLTRKRQPPRSGVDSGENDVFPQNANFEIV